MTFQEELQIKEAVHSQSSISNRQLQEMNTTEDDFLLFQHDETTTSIVVSN